MQVEKKQYTTREHVVYASVVLLLLAAVLGTAFLFFTKPGLATFLLMLPVWFVCYLIKQAGR